jgi:hypothetical protein
MATFLSLLALGRLRYTPARGFVAALGIWTWLQAAAIAYARGMEGVAPASRYGDVLKIGLLAGLAAALVLLAEGRGRLRLAASVCVVVWLLSLGNGLLHATRDALAFTLPQRGADSRVQDGNLRGFVATGRSGWIDGKAAREIGYYAGSDRLAAILGDSPIRSILPSSIREPLPTSWPDAGTSFGRRFAPAVPQPEDTNVVGTYGDGGPVATGTIQSRLVPAPRLPYLEFRIAGRMGTPDLQLRLTSASGEIITAPVVRSPHRWARLRLRAPDSAFRITLTDTSQDGWLAVSPPREMGRLSYLAAWLIEHELTVRWGGCLCAAVWLLLLVWATFRHGPRHAAATPAGPHGPSPRRGNVEPSDM